MSALTRSQIQPGLWSSIWKLLRLRVIIFISGFKRSSLKRKIGTVILWLVIAGFLGFLIYISWGLQRFLQSPELAEVMGDTSLVLNSVPVLVIYAAFLGILLTSFGVLLQALYLAGDMDFLLTSPLPIRAVFSAKMLQAVMPNFALVCLFGLPVLYGLGASSGYHFLYYPMVLLVLIAMALAAAGISSLLVMLIVRIFPARRVAEVLGFLGAILSLICSQSGQLANMGDFSTEQANQAFASLSSLNNLWSPLAWAGRGLVDIGQGVWMTGIGYLSLTFILAVLIFGLALETSERMYYSGWADMQFHSQKQKAKRKKRSTSHSASTWKAFGARLLPADLRAIIVKDLLVMRRDLRNMSQLITPLILGVVYAFMLLRNGNDFTGLGENSPQWINQALSNASVYFNVGIALFVGWMLLARLAGMGFSQEGRSYWILKSAPISTSRLITAKFLVAYLPALVLCWGFLLVTWVLRAASINALLFSLPVIALTLVGNTGINLAFGISGANLDWSDPRKMQKGGAGCLASLLSAVYLPFTLGLFFAPPLLFAGFGLSESLGQALGLVLGGAASLACAAVPLWFVRAKVTRLGE